VIGFVVGHTKIVRVGCTDASEENLMRVAQGFVSWIDRAAKKGVTYRIEEKKHRFPRTDQRRGGGFMGEKKGRKATTTTDLFDLRRNGSVKPRTSWREGVKKRFVRGNVFFSE